MSSKIKAALTPVPCCARSTRMNVACPDLLRPSFSTPGLLARDLFARCIRRRVDLPAVILLSFADSRQTFVSRHRCSATEVCTPLFCNVFFSRVILCIRWPVLFCQASYSNGVHSAHGVALPTVQEKVTRTVKSLKLDVHLRIV